MSDLYEITCLWSMRLPLFTTELTPDEQHRLLAANFGSIATLRVAYRCRSLMT